MTPETRNALIAAAVILVGFALLAYFMPAIMVAIGAFSPIAAAAVAVLFVGAFFAVFWLRGRARRR